MILRERIEKLVEDNREKSLRMAKWLFEHPEPALKEVESSKYLAQCLRDEGFEVEEKLAGMETAFKAVKKRGNGPRIAFLAEYDALPGCGHACGHHMIASMSIGAAMALANALDTFNGEIAIFGTPAEETGEGKSYLTDQGVFDGYDAALMIHPNSVSSMYPEMIAIGGIDFEFRGHAAHAGAYPHEGVNALDAVIQLFNSINALRQQLKDGTRVHGIILEAGKAVNVIPDKGVVRMEFRAKEQEYFNSVVEKVVNCAKGAALATGCELSYDWFEPICKGMRHNVTIANVAADLMKEFGVYDDSELKGGATDVGNVSQVIPTIQPMLSVTEEPLIIHTPEFRDATMLPLGMERMMIGTKILALTGLALLEDPELIKAAKREHDGK